MKSSSDGICVAGARVLSLSCVAAATCLYDCAAAPSRAGATLPDPGSDPGGAAAAAVDSLATTSPARVSCSPVSRGSLYCSPGVPAVSLAPLLLLPALSEEIAALSPAAVVVVVGGGGGGPDELTRRAACSPPGLAATLRS